MDLSEYADFAAKVAAQRERNGRRSRTNRPISDDGEVVGVLAEIGVCVAMGVDPKKHVHAKGRTKGYFSTIDGYKIKAFGSRHRHGNLIVKHATADYYVALYVDSDAYVTITGWADRDDILAYGEERAIRRGENLYVARWFPMTHLRNPGHPFQDPAPPAPAAPSGPTQMELF